MEFSGRSAFREPSQFLCFGTKCCVYKHCKDRSATTPKLSRYCKLLVFFSRGSARSNLCMVHYVFRTQLTYLDDCAGGPEPIPDGGLKTT